MIKPGLNKCSRMNVTIRSAELTSILPEGTPRLILSHHPPPVLLWTIVFSFTLVPWAIYFCFGHGTICRSCLLEWAINQFRCWLLTPTGLFHRCSSMSCRQDHIVDPSIYAWTDLFGDTRWTGDTTSVSPFICRPHLH